jgi:hypothetical protein
MDRARAARLHAARVPRFAACARPPSASTSAGTQRIAFALAGGFAGLAGGLYAFSKGSISPETLGIPRSVDALVMVLLGGLNALAGPLLGAAASPGSRYAARGSPNTGAPCWARRSCHRHRMPIGNRRRAAACCDARRDQCRTPMRLTLGETAADSTASYT